MVSTHSRPKAAGAPSDTPSTSPTQFQHTAARRRLVAKTRSLISVFRFQHTAARRRLVTLHIHQTSGHYVSTHSRPKAAGLQSCSCP